MESEGREDRVAHLHLLSEKLAANSYPPGDFAASVDLSHICIRDASQQVALRTGVAARHT